MRKKILRSLALYLLPFIGSLLIRVIYHTNKKRFHIPQNIPSESIIVAFWHGDLLLQPYIYYKIRKTPKINVMISDHFDGKIIAKTMEFFHLNTIHGSSTRGSTKVLIQAIKSLKDGYDIGITPDGPKGPRHEVADGIVAMAQKTKTKIMAFSVVPKSYWQLKSWDKFVIPKPFGEIDFYASEPFSVDEMSLEEATNLIKQKLLEYRYDEIDSK